jgi:dTDP-4-dehydrorhamnose 3,5-epimerase-like enzyme
MLPGFKEQDIVKNIDERSFFAEIYREDARLTRATTNGDVVYRLTA